MKLVSACLLGVNCRWDGGSKSNEKVIKLLGEDDLIYVCPEQLGGLRTPRIPSEQLMGDVYNKRGEDVTEQFIRGAFQTLAIAKMYGATEFIGAKNSPSCGVGDVYDGTFTNKLTKGDGITTKVLRMHGIKVISEGEL